jgi:hypothetical protein
MNGVRVRLISFPCSREPAGSGSRFCANESNGRQASLKVVLPTFTTFKLKVVPFPGLKVVKVVPWLYNGNSGFSLQ